MRRYRRVQIKLHIVTGWLTFMLSTVSTTAKLGTASAMTRPTIANCMTAQEMKQLMRFHFGTACIYDPCLSGQRRDAQQSNSCMKARHIRSEIVLNTNSAKQSHCMQLVIVIGMPHCHEMAGYCTRQCISEDSEHCIMKDLPTTALALLDCKWPIKCHLMSCGNCGAFSDNSCSAVLVVVTAKLGFV